MELLVIRGPTFPLWGSSGTGAGTGIGGWVGGGGGEGGMQGIASE